MQRKELINLTLRYLIIVIIALSSSILYLIFTPLTVYPSFWIISLFFNAQLNGSMIYVGKDIISLIPACIAGSAYLLLLILNLTTPMPALKRVKSISFLILSFLALNILRIVILSFLLLYGYSYFKQIHEFTWYFTSTLLVVLLWFANIYLFKIRNIPFFTDAKSLLSDAKKQKD